AWLEANTVGWRDLRERAAAFPPERVADITGVPVETIVGLARRYATTAPALIKTADGGQRHRNGGQTARAVRRLPAIGGPGGVRGGGLAYSTGGHIAYEREAVGGPRRDCPATPRVVNMNRLGAALTGEVTDPPIMSLFVYGANPVVSTPNTGRIVAGLRREDLFTVVHELFLTDTARYADIVLPATSQLEQTDLHDAYGHNYLQYNAPAIAPLGEAKSNWEVMRLLAQAMGYQEPWLYETVDEIIAGLLDASRAATPTFAGITLQRLKDEGTVRHLPPG